MIKIIKPPTNPSNNPIYREVKIFLAGSIEMGKASDWQKIVSSRIRTVSELCSKSIRVLNPRREAWDSSWTQDFENPQFYQQVSWELKALESADIIFMHLEGDTISPISLLELGLHIKQKKIIVHVDKNFSRKGNLDITCNFYNIPIFSDFEKALIYLERLIEIK